MPSVSIIICTRDRAEDLRETLEAMRSVCIPASLPSELIVVDNGSSDGTGELARSFRLPQMSVRCLYEGRRGKGFAYNAGVAAARGGVVLFTDDDVRPPADWVSGMCGPLLSGRADAVAGGVSIAPHLRRPWMTPLHRAALASTDGLDPDDPPGLVGANMAFSRRILSRVPLFDTDLGPGALGFGDETLLSLQIKAAGYRLGSAFAVSVEHHFDPSRLLRESWLSRAERGGRSEAYIAYHWNHDPQPFRAALLLKRRLRLAQWRLTRRPEMMAEGIPEWEYHSLREIGFLEQYGRERQGTPHYDRHGLVKRAS